MDVLKPNEIKMTKEQREKFIEFILGDDLDFYEDYVVNLSDNEQKYFFRENSDFMNDYPVHIDRIYLLQDKMFRNILRMIGEYNVKNRE